LLSFLHLKKPTPRIALIGIRERLWKGSKLWNSCGNLPMATKIRLQADLKEFLSLLASNKVEYLLIGGYAVGYYGCPRPTGDLDVWVAMTRENADRLVRTFSQFGLSVPAEKFLQENSIVRMGVPPFRLEVLTTIDGVDFGECYAARHRASIDGVDVDLISLADLRKNKAASGRAKDLSDLENLPQADND